MTTPNAWFTISTTDGAEIYISRHIEGSTDPTGIPNLKQGATVGPGSIMSSDWEHGDKVLFYAGSTSESQYKAYQKSGDYSSMFTLDPGTYAIMIKMKGACHGYIQHNDKNGDKFSKKSVHAPNTLRENMGLQHGEAMFFEHSY